MSFSSNQVVALTGISLRQLQWWDERGLVSPAREGRNRLYSLADPTRLPVTGALHPPEAGMSRRQPPAHRVQKVFRPCLWQGFFVLAPTQTATEEPKGNGTQAP